MDSKTLNLQIKYWRASAKENFRTAEDLFKTKHYDSCLFFCHLALEKLLKGMVIEKSEKETPYIHDLEKLAVLAGFSLSDDARSYLRTISTFNIAGRYGDEKFNFYKKCTKKYTEEYLITSKELFVWLEKNYQKK